MSALREIAGWFAFGTQDYAFWLLVVSGICFAAERLRPWRVGQSWRRPLFAQDLAWLALNGHIWGVLLWRLPVNPGAWVDAAFTGAGLRVPAAFALLSGAPVAVQFVVLLVLKDLIDWCVHNLLHRVGWLWEFHKVHHSIEALDWIGNFRFHWMEILVYRSIIYLPLVVLGIHGKVFLWHGVLTTLIGHLNHANLALSWGPLRYVINSPRMHVWHHDFVVRGSAGKNFAVVFSAWDWLFGTAHLPDGQPARLGFEGMERFPKSLVGRLTLPLSRWVPRVAGAPSTPGTPGA